MTGLDEGRLLAYLDGELEPEEGSDLEAWLEESPEARAALEETRRRRALVADAVAALEPPPCDLAGQRARFRRSLGSLPAGRAGSGAWRRAGLARAAGIVLLLGAAGVSAAVPGSPVRAWLDSALGGEADPARATAVVDEEEAGASDEVGLRVRPADGRLEIALTDLPPGREVLVRLVDAERGAVYAYGASFRSGAGRIDATLTAGGSGPVRVEIPRATAAATLRVDGRVWLEKRGERVDFPGPSAVVSSGTIRFEGVR